MLERHSDRCEHCCGHASRDWDSVSRYAQHILLPARASIPERKSRGRLLPTRQATVDRPEWLSDTTLGTTASSDRTHRRYFSPFGLAMPRPSETFCSRVIAKLRVLVAIDTARSRPRRRPLATRSRGEAGKCQDRLAPGKAMQLRAARLESSRSLALDVIGAGEDDGTGGERHRNAEHGQKIEETLSQYWDKCPNIGTLRKQVYLPRATLQHTGSPFR